METGRLFVPGRVRSLRIQRLGHRGVASIRIGQRRLGLSGEPPLEAAYEMRNLARAHAAELFDQVPVPGPRR